MTLLLTNLGGQTMGVWLVGGMVRDQWLHRHRNRIGHDRKVQPMNMDLFLAPDHQSPELYLAPVGAPLVGISAPPAAMAGVPASPSCNAGAPSA
ncbi:MAG: hypothetical protein TQ37_08685 [Candidatus Synechococcus spongiarum 15L]|uniref:Poly A polymerase head domain-containing protein n=2 Tax=Candidatus Synechococcus spongiarum TaxID=431041 RepID=A0A1T1D1W6_9SYNE|nr:hypothetical protein [Candidatus Synechococcus spongiarum]KKZ10444.1 MAG: hypothetical protein TQ37_08685 [Candidatus Synechococcus spongiarum 15L]OOV34814.1 hypothetical protein BV53_04945 [Candidatus Synechococcus spongiarum LMB bulk15N]